MMRALAGSWGFREIAIGTSRCTTMPATIWCDTQARVATLAKWGKLSLIAAQRGGMVGVAIVREGGVEGETVAVSTVWEGGTDSGRVVAAATAAPRCAVEAAAVPQPAS